MKLLILEAETLVANHEGKVLLFNKHFAQIMDFLTITYTLSQLWQEKG